MPKPRLVVITNIPSPYRLHTFALLHEEMERRGFALEVLFMAISESGRYWTVNPKEWQFSGHLASGIHPHLLGMEMHLNPGIWGTVLRNPPRWLIIGGGWQFPTSLGLFLLKPFYRRRTSMLVWSEANYRFSSHSRGIVNYLRRSVLGSSDALVIPGEVARKTLYEHWQIAPSKIIYWPNLVDETQFNKRVVELRVQRAALRTKYQIPEKNIVLFWSASLNEYTKGNLNFLEAIAPVATPNLSILLAGEGPNRTRIEQMIRSHPELDVRLLGHVSTDIVLECLALSNVAILPSLRDSNPLAIIEAMWAELPILTSVNCGNWPETIRPGKNGWLIDPACPEQITQAVREILTCSPGQLASMGKESLALAQEHFESRRMITRFVDDLTTAFPSQI